MIAAPASRSAPAPRARSRPRARRPARRRACRARSSAALPLSPSCVGGHAGEEARLGARLVERQRTIEGRFRLCGDDAVRRRGQRLAEIGFAIGVVAAERQNLAPRLDGVVEAAEPQIDRRQHLVAACIVWMLARCFSTWAIMLSIERSPRSAARCGAQRLARQSRRANEDIECDGAERQQQQAGKRGGAAAPERGGGPTGLSATAASAAAIRRRDTSTLAASASGAPIRPAARSRSISAS